MKAVNSAAPFEEKRIRGFCLPWLNPDLRKLIQTRNSLKKKSQNAKMGEEKIFLYAEYKLHRNKVTFEIRKPKKTLLYKFDQSKCKAACQALEDIFSTVGKKLAEKFSGVWNMEHGNLFSSTEVTPELIKKQLDSLDVKKRQV